MQSLETVIGILCTICLTGIIARRAGVASPIMFLLGGVLLSFLPGTPTTIIPPEVILPLLLPPILMEAAYFTSLRDFKKNLRWILLLATGLVIVTTVIIGIASHWTIPGMTLAAGCVLGAIISPPDAAAATSVIKKQRVPRRVVNILEGESLINDATGLVLYSFAVNAVVTGQFSAEKAVLHFGWMALVGCTVGLLTSLLFVRIFPLIRDHSIEILATFAVPYAAYLIAEKAHASGVLAVVIAGLLVGWRAPRLFPAQFRLPAEEIWRMVVYTLNALVFLIIGLEIPGIMERLSGYSIGELLGYAAAVCAVTVLIRFVWVYSLAYLVPFLVLRLDRGDYYPSWQNVLIVAWTGLRGVVTLATALALPVTVADGASFPHRDLIIFLATTVILFTLGVQGVLLPWLIQRVRLSFNLDILQEDWKARMEATQLALERIRSLETSGSGHLPALARIKGFYEDRLESLGDGPNTPLIPNEEPEVNSHPLIQSERRLWNDVLEVEREAVIGLRHRFAIGDDTMNNILRDIDLMATRFANGRNI